MHCNCMHAQSLQQVLMQKRQRVIHIELTEYILDAKKKKKKNIPVCPHPKIPASAAA